MSKELHDYELWYSPLKKHAFALVMAISYFITYILNNLVKAYVLNADVKMMLRQPLQDGKWANLLTKLHEYDIEVRPSKVVMGQGVTVS